MTYVIVALFILVIAVLMRVQGNAIKRAGTIGGTSGGFYDEVRRFVYEAEGNEFASPEFVPPNLIPV